MAGRFCAREALLAEGHAGEGVVGMGPAPEHAPIWPPGFVGSITHSGSLAAAAVSRELRGLGIDAEELIPEATASRVMHRILTQAERASLESPAWPQGLDLRQKVTLTFSAKESLYKCLHPLIGKYFGFDAAELVQVTAESWTIRMTRAQGPFPAGWSTEGRHEWLAGGGVLTVLELRSGERAR